MPASTVVQEKEAVDVVPHISLMTKLGRTGYSLSEILAEFADNSIDASPNGHVNVDVGVDRKRVTVVDDGIGMTKDQLIKGLTIAHSLKTEKLGEYGMGMKAAAVALGRAFEIVTQPRDGKNSYRVAWNAEAWAKRGKWEYVVETLPKKRQHGTSITVSELNFPVMGRVGNLRNELGRRFGPFVKRRQATIRVNGVKCKAQETELLAEKGLKVDNPKDFKLKTKNGETIHGWVGLLKNSSQRGLYGFDTFRRGRLITYYDKFGFQPHPTTARIVGEVHMDHVPVTSDKREWVKTDPLYTEAEELVSTFIEPYLTEARRLSSNATVLKSVQLSRLAKFKEGLLEAFNSAWLKEFTLPERGIGVPAARANASVQVVETEKEKREPGDSEGSAEPQETDRTRTPKKTQDAGPKKLRIKGREFDYQHKFGSLGADAPWMQYNWEEKTRELVVITNQDSPAFRSSSDATYLAFLHVVEAVSQLIMNEVGADFPRYEEIRQTLLRESTRHVADMRAR